MISKLTRLSPRNVSDVANKIIYQISASIKMQNAISARKRDISMITVSHCSKRKADAILVSLNINNIPCKLELDTGASVTVIPENV